MKKHILAIAVVASLGTVPLTTASATTAPSTPAAAASVQVGHVAGKLIRKRLGKKLGEFGGAVQAFCEGAGAAVGGIGGTFLGPVGTVIGSGIGAA